MFFAISKLLNEHFARYDRPFCFFGLPSCRDKSTFIPGITGALRYELKKTDENSVVISAEVKSKIRLKTTRSKHAGSLRKNTVLIIINTKKRALRVNRVDTRKGVVPCRCILSLSLYFFPQQNLFPLFCDRRFLLIRRRVSCPNAPTYYPRHGVYIQIVKPLLRGIITQVIYFNYFAGYTQTPGKPTISLSFLSLARPSRSSNHAMLNQKVTLLAV